MGFRIRKSFGGKYFRVNISKSGIGYSYGVPGFRKTHLSNGRNRTTASIPGTGISYVTESKGVKKNSNTKNNRIQNYVYDEIDNSKDIDNVSEILYENSSHDEFVAALKKAKNFWTWAVVLIVVGIFPLLGGGFPFGVLLIGIGIYLWVYMNKNLKVNVEYTVDEDASNYKEFKEVWLKINNCKKIWEIVTETNNSNTKVHAGAGRSVDRKTTKFEEVKLPYLNIGEEKILKLKLRKKEVLFLKDKILIFENQKIAGIDYKDLKLLFSEQRFVESETVSSDADIVDYTWQYVNKSGQPDKRYSNNRKLPICLYGKIIISDNEDSFNIELQISNYEVYKELIEQAKEFIKNS